MFACQLRVALLRRLLFALGVGRPFVEPQCFQSDVDCVLGARLRRITRLPDQLCAP